MIVLLNVDKVIKIIRNADEPKADLIARSSSPSARPRTSSRSACASWRKLEHIKIEQELEDLQKEQKGLEKILGSRKALRGAGDRGDRGRRQEPSATSAARVIEESEKAVRRDAGDRRAGDGDLLEERLGARAPGAGRGRCRRSRSRKATRSAR